MTFHAAMAFATVLLVCMALVVRAVAHLMNAVTARIKSRPRCMWVEIFECLTMLFVTALMFQLAIRAGVIP